MELYFGKIKPLTNKINFCQVFLNENQTKYLGSIFFGENITFSWTKNISFLTELQMQQILSFIRQNKE